MKRIIKMPHDVVTFIEKLRTELREHIDFACDTAISRLLPPTVASAFKSPSQEDGRDLRNKNDKNLTPRGVEILYRVFDDGGGYNRAAKMLTISQSAAKNRKAMWTRLGGANRKKEILDIDTI